MAAVLQSTLRVALINAVSGPAQAVTRSLSQLNAAAARNTAALDGMRGRMAASLGMGYALARSLQAPVMAGVNFQTQLEDIGQKADIPVARLRALGAELQKVGRQTNQSGTDIATGMDTLMGMGASESDALGLLPAIGRAATAYNASIVDLSNAGYAALDNLKVPANQFAGALDAMALAGKAGAFELKDMSQYFPALGAGYQALGQKGVPAVADLAAALQIVRKGAGDSSEAANNLKNVIQKIKAPQTVKAFKEMGVNLEKELAKSAKRGLTPIEAIAEITNKALKGDLSKIGDLFSDAQVQAGLRPLIQNIDLYRQIRADAMKAQGVVQADYDRRIMTSRGALLRMKATLEGLSISIGSALLPAMNQVIDTFVPIINQISSLAETYPRATAAIIGTTASLIALRVALTGLRFVGLFAQGGLIAAATGAVRMASALLTVLNPLALVRNALIGLRIAMLSTGVGAIVLAVAAGGLLIYNNWSNLVTLFSAFGSSFRKAVKPVLPIIRPIIKAVRGLYDSVSNLLGPVDNLGQSWFSMGRIAGKAVGDAVVTVTRWMADLPRSLSTTDWSGVGQSMLAGISGAFSRASGIAASLTTSFKTAFSSIDWSALGRNILDGIGRGFAGAVSIVTSLRSSITSAITSIDWNAAGAGLGAGITGLFETITSAYRSLNWGGIGEFIGSAIRESLIGIVDIGGAILSSWTGSSGGPGLARTLSQSLASAITGFDWLNVGRTVVETMGAGIKAGAQLLNGLVIGLFDIDLSVYGAKMIQSFQDSTGVKVNDLVVWAQNIPARIIAAIGSIDLSAVGSAMIQSLWNGISSKFEEMMGWMQQIPSRIKALISQIDLSAYNPLSGVKSLLGFGGSPPPAANNNTPSVDGARASGGPVVAGRTYQVNERGMELFTPGRSGVISPHEAYQAAAAGSSQRAGGMAGPVTVHLQMVNTFTSPSDPYAADKMAQRTANAIKSAVEGSFSD